MISLIMGLTGSGKSLLASYIAHRASIGKSVNFRGFYISALKDYGMKKYDYVFTNFPSQGCYSLDFDTLGYCAYERCLMVIDEVQLFADSRNFKSFGDNLKFFFSMARHDKIDIVMCSQSHSAVDARIRSLLHKIYYVDSIGKIIRVREIIHYFDVHGKIDEGYEYARGLNTKYFYAPRLYKYNDTYAKIKPVELKPVEYVPWDSKAISCDSESPIMQQATQPPVAAVAVADGDSDT